jgi:hypothetical protein
VVGSLFGLPLVSCCFLSGLFLAFGLLGGGKGGRKRDEGKGISEDSAKSLEIWE